MVLAAHAGRTGASGAGGLGDRTLFWGEMSGERCDGPGNAAHDGDRLLGGTAPRTTEDEAAGMFIFYSNKFGCLGSILASVVLTAVLLLALRSCSGGIGGPGPL